MELSFAQDIKVAVFQASPRIFQNSISKTLAPSRQRGYSSMLCFYFGVVFFFFFFMLEVLTYIRSKYQWDLSKVKVLCIFVKHFATVVMLIYTVLTSVCTSHCRVGHDRNWIRRRGCTLLTIFQALSRVCIQSMYTLKAC